MDLTVRSAERPGQDYVLLKMGAEGALPPIQPGQFAELKVEHSPTTFLRRPISVNFVDEEKAEVWFLVHEIGEGTRALGQLKPGQMLNVVMPLGNGFTMPVASSERVLLVGGGVGTAPLLYFGKKLQEAGICPDFLLGGRTVHHIMQLDQFRQYGRVHVSTEDASMGEQGFVTQHSVLRESVFDRIYTCGPKPMMVAVARYASERQIPCEVSLENMMACGVGACLCCVENTVEGHVCVCKEGPVFNAKRLLWQI